MNQEAFTVLDGIALTEAVAILDAREVAEHVFATIIWSNEAESTV